VDGGGWLGQMPAMFGVPAFVDFGGAGVIQVVGGFAALSTAWILGAARQVQRRHGDGNFRGTTSCWCWFGCLLALVGWIGLDSATSMLFYGANAERWCAR